MSLIVYPGGAPNMGDMGNILGDAWSWAKKHPLAIIAPPLYIGAETLKAVPTILSSAKHEVQDVVGAFRPAQPPQVDVLSSGLTQLGIGSGSGGEPGSSSTVPIILIGAAAAAGLLLLAFGRKKKK